MSCHDDWVTTHADYLVDGGIAAEAEVSAGYVVTDCARYDDDRYAEGAVAVARLHQLQGWLERLCTHARVLLGEHNSQWLWLGGEGIWSNLKTSDDEEGVDRELLQVFGYGFYTYLTRQCPANGSHSYIETVELISHACYDNSYRFVPSMLPPLHAQPCTSLQLSSLKLPSTKPVRLSKIPSTRQFSTSALLTNALTAALAPHAGAPIATTPRLIAAWNTSQWDQRKSGK